MVSGRIARSKYMVMEGLCQEMLELMKDRRMESLVSGMVAKSKKSGRSRNVRLDYGCPECRCTKQKPEWIPVANLAAQAYCHRSFCHRVINDREDVREDQIQYPSWSERRSHAKAVPSSSRVGNCYQQEGWREGRSQTIGEAYGH